MLQGAWGHAHVFTHNERASFIKLLSTKICLARNFFLEKNRSTNQISISCISLITENHVEIWLVKSCLYQGNNFKLSKFLCLAALWNWALVLDLSPFKGGMHKWMGTLVIDNSVSRMSWNSLHHIVHQTKCILLICVALHGTGYIPKPIVFLEW